MHVIVDLEDKVGAIPLRPLLSKSVRFLISKKAYTACTVLKMTSNWQKSPDVFIGITGCLITDCIFGETFVLISVKFPFAIMAKLWKLYSLEPIPIAAGNETVILDLLSVKIPRSELDSQVMPPTASGKGGTCSTGSQSAKEAVCWTLSLHP